MFNYIDLVIVIIFLAVVFIEAKRGFGKAVFDTAGILVAVKFAPVVTSWLTNSIRLSASASTNEAIIYTFFFLLIGAGLVLLGRLLYSTTLISAEVFEPLLGGVCGFISAIVLSHVFVRIVWLSSGGGDVPMDIANSLIGKEMLTFEGYHAFIERLQGSNNSRSDQVITH